MKTQTSVYLENIGLCEHCGALLTMQDMPADAIDTDWKCPKCEGLLGNKTFGYEEINGKEQKTQWVGSDGKWTKTKPTKNFDLGNWYVIIKPASIGISI